MHASVFRGSSGPRRRPHHELVRRTVMPIQKGNRAAFRGQPSRCGRRAAERIASPRKALYLALCTGLLGAVGAVDAIAQALPLDPDTIPKYVIPLVIPPEMPESSA